MSPKTRNASLCRTEYWIVVSVFFLCLGVHGAEVNRLSFDSTLSKFEVSAGQDAFLAFNTTEDFLFLMECNSSVLLKKAFCIPCRIRTSPEFYTNVSTETSLFMYNNSEFGHILDRQLCVQIRTPPPGAYSCNACIGFENKTCIDPALHETVKLIVQQGQVVPQHEVRGFDTLVVTWIPSINASLRVAKPGSQNEFVADARGIGKAEINLQKEYLNATGYLVYTVEPVGLDYAPVSDAIFLNNGTWCFIRVKSPVDPILDTACSSAPKFNGNISFVVSGIPFNRTLTDNSFRWFAPSPPTLDIRFFFNKPLASADVVPVSLSATKLDANISVWVFQSDTLTFNGLSEEKINSFLGDMTVNCPDGVFSWNKSTTIIRAGVDSFDDPDKANCTIHLNKFNAHIDKSFNPLKSTALKVDVQAGSTIIGTFKIKQNLTELKYTPSIAVLNITTGEPIIATSVISTNGTDAKFSLFVPHQSTLTAENYSLGFLNDPLSQGCKVESRNLKCSPFFPPVPDLTFSDEAISLNFDDRVLWLLNNITIHPTESDNKDIAQDNLVMVLKSRLLDAEIPSNKTGTKTSANFTAIVPVGQLSVTAYDNASGEVRKTKTYEIALYSQQGPQYELMNLDVEVPFTLNWLTKTDYEPMKEYLQQKNFWECFQLRAIDGTNAEHLIPLKKDSPTLQIESANYSFAVDSCNTSYTRLTLDLKPSDPSMKTSKDKDLPFNVNFTVSGVLSTTLSVILEFRFSLEVTVHTESEFANPDENSDEEDDEDSNKLSKQLIVKINNAETELKCSGKRCGCQGLYEISAENVTVTFHVLNKEAYSVDKRKFLYKPTDLFPGKNVTVEVTLKKQNALSNLFGDNEQLLVVIGLATALVIVVLWCGYQVIRYCQQRARRYRIIDEYADDEDVGLSDFGTRSGSA